MKKTHGIGIIILLVLIVFAQLTVMFFWANEKADYHVDELYSMEYAHIFTQEVDLKSAGASQIFSGVLLDKRIPSGSFWNINEWNDISQMEKVFTVTSAESIFSQSPAKVIGLMISGKNYYGLLNAFESIFSNGARSKYPGIILNMVCFALTQFILVLIMNRLHMSSPSIILAVLMYGFGTLIIGLVEFIRFYSLVLLLVTLIFYLHVIMWQDKRWWIQVICEVCALFLVYLVFMDSELTLAISGALFLSFSLGLVIRKKWIQFSYYFVPVLAAAVFYLGRNTGFLNMLKDLGSLALGGSGPMQWVSENTITFTFARAFERIGDYWQKELGDRIFGSVIITIIFAVLILTLLVINIVKKRKIRMSCDGGFVMIISAVVTVYTVFTLLADFDQTRYYSPVVPLFILMLWFAADRLMQIHKSKVPKRIFWAIAAVTVVAIAVTSFVRGLNKNFYVEYIYRDKKDSIRLLEQYSDYDRIVLRSQKWDSLYSCIYYSDGNVKIFMAEDGAYFLREDSPVQVLLWMDAYTDPYLQQEIMGRSGYSIRHIADTAYSTVYLCQRMY